MTYILGLVITSLVGIFGFLFSSHHKEKLDQEQRLKLQRLTQSKLSAPMPQNNLTKQDSVNTPTRLPPTAPAKSKPVNGPLAVIGVIISILISIFTLSFFFKKNQQQQRDRFGRLLPNKDQKTRLKNLQKKITGKPQNNMRRF